MQDNTLSQPRSGPVQKSSFKFVASFVVLGSLLTLGLVSVYMPRMILWYFDPPMPMGVSCTSSIRWAIGRLLLAQVYSVGVGAVFGLIVGLKLRRK